MPFTFTIDQIKELLQPCVYTFWRGPQRLYIGFSATGAARIFERGHPTFWRAISEGMDQITLTFYKDALSARRAEDLDIAEHRPLWNRQRRHNGKTREILAALAAGNTGASVAREFNLSRERIRQIKQRNIQA